MNGVLARFLHQASDFFQHVHLRLRDGCASSKDGGDAGEHKWRARQVIQLSVSIKLRDQSLCAVAESAAQVVVRCRRVIRRRAVVEPRLAADGRGACASRR